MKARMSPGFARLGRPPHSLKVNQAEEEAEERRS